MDAFSATYAVRKLMDFLFNSDEWCRSTLRSLSGERISLFLGLEELIKKLDSDLKLVEVVLADAEEKQISNRGVRMWLQQLKDFIYDVEDMFDELEIEAARNPAVQCPDDAMDTRQGKASLFVAIGNKRARLMGHFKHFLGNYFRPDSTSTTSPKSNKVVTRLNIADGVKELIDTFEKILETKTKLDLMANNITEQGGQQQLMKRPSTSSMLNAQFVMVGRDKEKSKLIGKLLDREEDVQSFEKPNVSLLSIVGMGGIGKSTLAKDIYNDPIVENHFQTMKWVIVGETFDPKGLIKNLLGDQTSEDIELELLHTRLNHECQKWRNFLIVLDDVWNEDATKWELLWDPLTHGTKGSKVLITCRNKKVTIATHTKPTIELKGMDHDNCFSIFKKHAFLSGDFKSYPNLLTIGQDIVKKLGGLPLAAKVVGSSLFGVFDEQTWKKYLNDKPWLHKDDSIMGALIWSFNLMPTHLKPCFGYCALLPKDKRINGEDLIRKWMASGLIDSQVSSKLEDVGLDYLNTLVQLSFIEDRSYFQGQGWYVMPDLVMHDLIHDLAQLVASHECKVLGVNKYKKSENSGHPRHLIFDDSNVLGKKDYQKIRTIVTTLTKSSIPKLNDFLEKLKYVRILDITRYDYHDCKDVKEIPFSSLIHLRYLNVPCAGYLSDSVTDLPKLQYLLCQLYGSDIHNDIHLRHMRKLVNLRHLGVDFIVGNESGYKIEELGDLKELVGPLCINNLERVASKEDARKSRMNNKENLKELELIWGKYSDMHNEHMQVLEGLMPHNNIQMLTIDSYMGIQFPSWVADSMVLCNLQKMKLIHCRKVKSLPALGQLPQLKNLRLRNLGEVCSIGQEFYGSWDVESSTFSSLEELDIDTLDNLTAWLGKKWHFPSLRSLAICDCGKLSSMPLEFSVLQKLNITGCGQALDTYLETLCGRKAGAGAGANIHSGPIFPVLKYLDIDSVQLLDNILGNAHTFCNASTLETVEVRSSTTETGEEFWGPEKSNDEKGDQWKEFTSLRSLCFSCCDSLLHLPPHLHRLPSLEELEIEFCTTLEQCRAVVYQSRCSV